MLRMLRKRRELHQAGALSVFEIRRGASSMLKNGFVSGDGQAVVVHAVAVLPLSSKPL